MSDPLPVNRAAHVLGLSRQRVHQLIARGDLKAHRWDGRRWCIVPSDLEAYLSSRESAELTSALDRF